MTNKIRQFNKVCNNLVATGYKIVGYGDDTTKCYFSIGKAQHETIVGYIDNRTLDVIWTSQLIKKSIAM